MVEEQIDKNRRVASPAGFEQRGTAIDQRVGVGKDVDLLMEGHAPAYAGGEGETGAALDPISGEVAGHDGRLGG